MTRVILTRIPPRSEYSATFITHQIQNKKRPSLFHENRIDEEMNDENEYESENHNHNLTTPSELGRSQSP